MDVIYNPIFIGVVLYLFVLIAFGFLPFKDNATGFAIGNRNIGLIGFASSMGGNF